MAVYSMLLFGAFTALAVINSDDLTCDGKCIAVYLAMILGVLLSIASKLEKKS